MKSKGLFQIFVVLAILSGVLRVTARANAQGTGPIVVMRDLTDMDTIHTGYVDYMRFERWPLLLTAGQRFSVTVVPTYKGPNLFIFLLDSNGNQITNATGKLTTYQPAGLYYVQIQPDVEMGGGSYTVSFKPEQSGNITLDPSTIQAGGTAKITMELDTIPVEGYTSIEFTCRYDPNLVVIEKIFPGGAFGADPVVAKNEQLGSFVFAIAGTNGQKLYPKTTNEGGIVLFAAKQNNDKDNAIFTADARSPNPTAISDGGTNLMLARSPNPLATPTITPSGGSGSERIATITCNVRASTEKEKLIDLGAITATLTIIIRDSSCTLTGQVFAGKPVTVDLLDEKGGIVASVLANTDGIFSLTAPIGTYNLVAKSSGFLSAQGFTKITGGITCTKTTVTLFAGDITGDGIIDQWDAMSIGMNYNAKEPTVADLNNDGVINVLDLEVLAGNYLNKGPIAWP